MVEVNESVRRPELLPQFFTGDDFTLPLQQYEENLKWLFLQSQPHSRFAQLSRGGVGFIDTESEQLALLARGHRSP